MKIVLNAKRRRWKDESRLVRNILSQPRAASTQDYDVCFVWLRETNLQEKAWKQPGNTPSRRVNSNQRPDRPHGVLLQHDKAIFYVAKLTKKNATQNHGKFKAVSWQNR